MKKIFILLAGVGFTSLFAQQNIIFQNTNQGKFNFVSGDEFESEINFTMGDVMSKAVSTSNGTAYTISTLNGTPILEAGYPDLPKMTTSIIVPDDQNMQVQVVSSEYVDFTNIDIAPSKGTLSRTIDPSTVPFNYGDVYNHDVFYPFDLAHLDHPFILRDYRAQTITVNPIQYNAYTKTLRVYTSIRLAVSSSNTEAENTMVRNANSTTVE
jgi:gingipain R